MFYTVDFYRSVLYCCAAQNEQFFTRHHCTCLTSKPDGSHSWKTKMCNLDSSYYLLNIQINLKRIYLLIMSKSKPLRIFRIGCPLDECPCPLTSQTLSKVLNSISCIKAVLGIANSVQICHNCITFYFCTGVQLLQNESF